MKLEYIDTAFIFTYLAFTVLLGFWVSNRAKKNLDSYFLGGKSLPWYMLGLSNASGQFDIAGTMMMVSWMFVYGVKSVWIPWLWPVWNQIFLMIFLAVWLRRSNVLTGAEWLRTRFGDGTGTVLSHVSVIVFAIVAVIGFIAYAFEGIGKFATTFLPWDLSLQLGEISVSSERIYALLIMGVTTLYVIKGGMYSVVLTEVLQFITMTIACLAIGIIALNSVTYEQISASVPEGWHSFMVDWQLQLDWKSLVPEVQQKIQSDGYEMFAAFLMMAIFRGIFVSIAGPVPGYDMQRVLAARTPKEAALMSGTVSLVLYFPRYFMITGLAVLSLVYYDPEALMTSQGIDFEKILPFTLQRFMPAGVLGLVLAGLIAAFMSTFAANVNAGPAYIVNDLYKRFLNPAASDATLVKISYLASVLVVVLGIFFGFLVRSINDIFLWITGALFGGYALANVLKWIWWRFNGFGFFYGMVAGLVASLIAPLVVTEDFIAQYSIHSTYAMIFKFALVFVASAAGSVLGTLLTEPDDEDTLIEFYRNVRPWGFWGPVHQAAAKRYPALKQNQMFLRDMFNCLIGTGWQMCITLMPVYLVLREYDLVGLCALALLLFSVILKLNWFDKLEESIGIDRSPENANRIPY